MNNASKWVKKPEVKEVAEVKDKNKEVVEQTTKKKAGRPKKESK